MIQSTARSADKTDEIPAQLLPEPMARPSSMSAPLNIVFIITRADAVGGATVHVRDMVRALLDHGHRVLVLIGGTGPVLEEFDRYGIPYRSLRFLRRSVNPLRDLAGFAEMTRVLRQLKPDLVCAHTSKAGFLGRFACSYLGIPALYTPHGWTIANRISRVNAWMYRFAERAAGRRPATIINVCEAERELARVYHIAPEAKLAVIHNGVVDIQPHLWAQPARTSPRLLMAARFEPAKDHATLIRALATIQDLPWTLDLLGGGPGKNEMEQLAAKLGIASRVQFPGSVSDVEGRLSEVQIVVLSTKWEAFPLSILEAMRAGLPVVVSDVGGVREAVIDGETGFVVKPGDVQAMARALRLLISDAQLRQDLGRAGRKRYEVQFTFDHMFEQTLDLYRSVLAGNPATHNATAEEVTHGRQ